MHFEGDAPASRILCLLESHFLQFISEFSALQLSYSTVELFYYNIF